VQKLGSDCTTYPNQSSREVPLVYHKASAMAHVESTNDELPQSSTRIQTNQWAKGAIGVLDRIVTVVPCASILHRAECVIEAVARCNRTLCYAIHSVHVHSLPLSNAMPVNAGPVMLQLIGNNNSDVLW